MVSGPTHPTPEQTPMRRKGNDRFNLLVPAALALSVAAFCVCSCGTRPSGVPAEDEMASLLTDMYKAEAYASTDPDYAVNDSMRRVLRQSVLADHNMNEQSFNRFLDWYGHNIDRLGDIYDDVADRLEKEATGTDSRRNDDGRDGKGAVHNLWDGQRRVALSPFHARQRIDFELDASHVKQGEQIVWDFTVPVLPGRITAFVGADYTDGTFNSAEQTFTHRGTSQLILTLMPGKTPRRIFGQATYRAIHRETIFIDSIRLITRPSLDHSVAPSRTRAVPVR